MIRAAVIEAIHAYEKHALHRLQHLTLSDADFSQLVDELAHEMQHVIENASEIRRVQVLDVWVHRGGIACGGRP